MPMRNLLLNKRHCKVFNPSPDQVIKTQQILNPSPSKPKILAKRLPTPESPGLFLLCGNRKKLLLWNE